MDLTNYLMRGSSDQTSQLMAYGKDAAAKYMAGEGSLDALITKTARANDLNKHQIRNVAWVANNVAFGSLFVKDANVTFPVADPKKIAGAVDVKKTPEAPKGGRTKTASPVHLRTKGTYHPGEPIEPIEQLIFPRDMEKKAQADPNLNPEQPAVDLMHRLDRRLQGVESSLGEAQSMMKSAVAIMIDQGYQLMMDGVSAPDIRYALGSAGITDENLIKTSVAAIVRHAFTMNPALDRRLLEKRGSGRIADPAHPLIVAVKDLQKLASRRKVLSAQREELSKGVRSIRGFLKDRVRE